MPTTDTVDSSGRLAIVTDGSHRVEMWAPSFGASVPGASWPAVAPEAFCCPLWRTVDRSWWKRTDCDWNLLHS